MAWPHKLVRCFSGASAAVSSSPTPERIVGALAPARRLALVKPSLDIKSIQENADAIATNIKLRNGVGDPHKVAALAAILRRQRALLQDLQTQRRRASSDTSLEITEKVLLGKNLRSRIAEVDEEVSKLEDELYDEALHLPNATHPDVPPGPEANAKLMRHIGRMPDTENKRDHISIGDSFDMLDFARASAVAGPKFAFLRNLEIVNWAMRKLALRGFTPMLTPDVVKTGVIDACGFQSRGENSQVYDLEDSDLSLVGTAELPLAGYYMNSTIPEQELPIKMVAFSHCFRREAGSGGKQEGGLYRLHQFSKVEMFVIGRPEESDAQLQKLVNLQSEVVDELGLHARVLMMPSEELGASAYQKFDLEAWMPGRKTWGEISSATNCLDYQSRRLNIRCKTPSGQTYFPHTLNATACAVPRLILSLLETHHQADGSVKLPPALSAVQPWFNTAAKAK